ncbi:MAG: transglycosylase domain-containing protein [Deltaproteobacteria bacterium]|nr:transglycosylase domain-containing protein [Deltaproteobacteria bacterium]
MVMRWLRRRVRRLVAWAVAAGVAVVVAVAALGVVDPPFTPRSIYRRAVALLAWQRLPPHAPTVTLGRLPRHLVRALLVAEDARFYQHHGFDWEEIRKVAESEEIARGASTITMQVARNVFLWTGPRVRAPRKAGEVLLTPLLELLLTKNRILELYFDWCTFSPGTIGIGEAARKAFGVAPEELDVTQSVYLVACLPNPDLYCGEKSSRRHAARMRWIRSRMNAAGAVAAP